MLTFLSVVFCSLLSTAIGVSLYLRRQTCSYVKLCTYYTNKFLRCDLTLEEYLKVKGELRDGISPFLKWYMQKEGINIQ